MSRYESVYDTDRNRRAVAVGVLLTLVLTPAALVFPFLLPMHQLKTVYFELTGTWVSGNPFTVLRFLSGPLAGFATAYLTDGPWDRSVGNAMMAIATGMVALYGLIVGYYLLQSLLVWGSLPLLQIVVLPLVAGFYVGIIALFGGFLGSLVGHAVRTFVAWGE